MIHILCHRGSDGAKLLTDTLNRLAGRTVAVRNRGNRRIAAADLVVRWGGQEPVPPGVRVLNPHVVGDKYEELRQLRAAEIPVPPFMRIHPGRGPHEWRARVHHHTQARDLRANRLDGDYYVQILPIQYEFRVHVFGDVVIRAAEKIPGEGGVTDPVFRVYETGWRYAYNNKPHIRNAHRDLAKRAVTALGYNFGAVDIGQKTDGSNVVFEVNSAPGLDGETPVRYATKILAEAGVQ